MKKQKETEQEYLNRLVEEESKQPDFLEYPDEMTIHYIYSVGELTKFFKEIRDNEKLFGTRCVKCGFGYFPPRLNCAKCYTPCNWVELSGKGEIVAGTLIEFAVSNFGDKVPLTIAFIKMDEMDQSIRHTIIMKPEDKKMENLKKGIRVKVQFKPKDQRQGRITDFYFILDK